MVYGSNDQYLWRMLFLSFPFDDPRKSLEFQNVSPFSAWRSLLQTRMWAEKVIRAGVCVSLDRVYALRTLLSTVQGALPATEGSQGETSHNLVWVERVLRESKLLETEPISPEINLRARLHSYLAFSLENCGEGHSCARLRQRRLKSRSFLYDLRNYRADNGWGPYKPIGDVNWVHAEAIINVVLMNVMEFWIDTKPPLGLEATRAYSAPGCNNRKPADWAAVEGVWRRLVCFMDYRLVQTTFD